MHRKIIILVITMIVCILFSPCLKVSAMVENNSDSVFPFGFGDMENLIIYHTDNSINQTKNNINQSEQNTKNNINNAVNGAEKSINDNINTQFAKIDKLLETDTTDKTPIKEMSYSLNAIVKYTNDLWLMVGDTLESYGNADSGIYMGGKTFGITDYNAVINKFSVIFQIFAYSLAMLFFAINIMETALQYELMTARGAVKIFGRIFVSKIWIDLSTKICLIIMQINNGLLQSLLSTTRKNIYFSVPNISESLQVPSSAPIVGKLIDWIMSAIYIIPMWLIAALIGFTSFAIMIKLMLRTYEISILLVVSPTFFACMTADTTRQYFQRFITTFISVVAEILFMAIVYAIGTEWYIQDTTMSTITTKEDFWLWISSTAPSAIMILAMGLMMIKPPRVLKNLIG